MLNIPKIDVLKLEKKTNAYIFDNSISLKTPKGQILFASFFYRDKAFDLIMSEF